jgi:uncharacterized protein
MTNKTVLGIALLACAFAAQAQSAPAKKELVTRILKLQQPGIESMARALVEQPASELLGSAANALPARVAKDKQDAVAKEIQGDIQKYVDETVPLVQRRAVALAPVTIGPLLEEKFSEDELKQIVGIIESPVYSKFQKMGDDMQQQLVEKLVADTRPTVEPKLRALEQTIGRRLGVTPGQAAAPAAPAAKPAPKAPAKAASR